MLLPLITLPTLIILQRKDKRLAVGVVAARMTLDHEA